MTTAEIYNFDDHYAYVCECGCVEFILLKSHKIECAECEIQFGYCNTEEIL